MRFLDPKTLSRILSGLAGLLILRVTLSVVLKYVDYFPPNFDSDFLQGRQAYFRGIYQWAFYPHLVAGPVSLILGLILVSDRFRQRLPRWHRLLGRIQAGVVLLVVAPSGLAMAFRAEAGPAAGLGFAMLAVVTGVSVVAGWRAAVARRFADHRRWMWRCYLALCSTVVLRLIAGAATVTGLDVWWLDVFAAWGSWLIPLTVFELMGVGRRILQRHSGGLEISKLSSSQQ